MTRHRWLLIESHPGSTAGGMAIDADERFTEHANRARDRCEQPGGGQPAYDLGPGPTATEATGKASFRRFDDPSKRPCATALAWT